MLAIPKRECVPNTPHWNPRSAYLRTRSRLKEFENPGGLLSWWNTKAVRERVKALPEPGRLDLETRFQAHLEFLNSTGPRMDETTTNER